MELFFQNYSGPRLSLHDHEAQNGATDQIRRTRAGAMFEGQFGIRMA